MDNDGSNLLDTGNVGEEEVLEWSSRRATCVTVRCCAIYGKRADKHHRFRIQRRSGTGNTSISREMTMSMHEGDQQRVRKNT